MIKKQKKIIIDTDLGDDTDDAAAIMMAINSPELDIVGITTVFNNTMKRAEMVSDLCAQYNRNDIPIYAGHGIPIIERPVYQENPIQYDILRKENKHTFNKDMNAVEFMIQSARENPDLYIVEMGAMTNLGIAFYMAPEVMKHVNIIAMGGVFTCSSPEWNMLCDPEAARIVMDFAENLTMFGLDVTKHCFISDELLEQICNQSSERMQIYRNGVEIFRKKTGFPITFHDVVLIAYLIDSSIAQLKQSDYNIELYGENTRGAIVFKTNAYEIDLKTDKNFFYAEKIDIEKFYDLVLKRIS